MSGVENIVENDGLGIAATGMIIVFIALTLISMFIALLPRLLDALSFMLPEEHHSQPVGSLEADEQEHVAALGFVMHQRRTK